MKVRYLIYLHVLTNSLGARHDVVVGVLMSFKALGEGKDHNANYREAQRMIDSAVPATFPYCIAHTYC